MRRTDARAAAVLARTELRASARRIRGNRRQLVATLLGFAQFALLIPLLLLGALLSFGGRVVSGQPPVGTVAAACGVALVSGGFLGAASAFNQNRVGAVGSLVRTSVSPRAVAAGRIASELFQTAAVFGAPVVAVLVLVGIGAGTPVVPLAVGGAALLVLLVGTFVGRIVGGTLRYGGVLAGLSVWTKVGLFVLGTAAVFVGTQAALSQAMGGGGPYEFGASVPGFLPGRPLQAYAAVFLAPFGGRVGALGVGLVVSFLVSVPATAVVATVVEARLLTGDTSANRSEGSGHSREVPVPFARWPTGRVAWRHLLRTARDPKSMAHLGPLLFGGMAMTGGWISDPGLAWRMGPPAAVVAGAVVAGSAYCLNPMGDDRDQLPLLLTSVDSTGVLLRGRALAGIVPGLLLAVGIGTPTALVAHDPAYVAGQTVLAVVLLVAAAGTALGLGSLVPKFERSEYMNVERAHPSQFALIGFLFGWMLVGGVGLLLLAFTVSDGGPMTLLGIAWVVYLSVLATGTVGGYVYAVRKFDGLTMDDV